MSKKVEQEEVTEEVATLEVLTTESIELLDDSIQKEVKFLIKSLGINELQPLNPLVLEFQKLLPYKDLKYDKENDNTQEYTDAWTTIRSFNAETKRAKKTIKADVIKIGKSMDAIEKAFLASSEEIMTELQKNFKEYLDEKQKKKEEAKARKEAAMNEQIEVVQSEAQEAVLKAKKITAFNKIKYDTIEDFKNKRIQLIPMLNKEAIQEAVLAMKEYRMPSIVQAYGVLEEWELLDEEQQMEMAGKLKSIKADIQKEYDRGLEILEKKKLEEQTENVDKASWKGTAPAPQPFTNSINGPSAPPAEVFSVDAEKGQEIINDLAGLVKYYNSISVVNSKILLFKQKAAIMTIVDGLKDVMENIDQFNKS